MNQLKSPIAHLTADIGHNQPAEPIDQVRALTDRLGETHRNLVARFRDLELGCARVPDPIEREGDAGLVTDFIAQCQLHIRNAEAVHKQEKEFFLTSGRAVDTFFKRRCEKLAAALVPVVAGLKAYGDKVADAERRRHEITHQAAQEGALRATEEAERHRAEAERLAREGTSDAERQRAGDHWILAEEAAERAEAARLEMSLSLEPTRIRGDYGATAYVARNWTFEVIDLGQVPHEYVSLDIGAVKDAINKDGVRNIPGLRIFRAESLRIKGAG